MAVLDTTYCMNLAFTPLSRSVADAERPAVLRAQSRGATPYEDDGFEVHACKASDLAQNVSVRPNLLTTGFDTVDLSGHEELQRALAGIHQAGKISDVLAASVRDALDGAELPSSGGHTLTVLYVADEGLIMRVGGPNGLAVGGGDTKGMNGHAPAVSVHADQDVYGTPLVQLMDGRAPDLFHHDSPDGFNHDASLMLVNLWIPLQQITRPLVLADGASFDRARHQLRYGLPTQSFLDRDQDQVVNDIWTFAHHPDQRWFFRSEMDQRSAYVFNTLSTPHASAVLPGEDVAERCYLGLEAIEVALEVGDVAAAARLVSELDGCEVPVSAPPALRQAIDEMVDVITRAGSVSVMDVRQRQRWLDRARSARRSVLRMSLELRLVVSVAFGVERLGEPSHGRGTYESRRNLDG
ncbi:MAG: hypothetical protein WBB52_11220 [Acidimicrobiales bacterium]